jgi:endonuclease/exonuclease/phosphatase (EEP) superfamily protein YafD
VKTVSILLGLLLCLSYLGGLHPVGDSFAVLRMPLAAGVALAVTWTAWPRFVRWPLAVLALVVMAQVPLARFASPSPGDFTVYQKNLWFANPELMALSREIRRSEADVVTLQEVSDTSRFMTSLLAPDYPHQAICRFPENVYLAVVSRHPLLSEPVCSVSRGLAAVQVAAPGGPVWVVSVHLQWPWPFDQGRQVAEMEALLAGLDGPVVIGGDFNMVPWGASVRRLARAAQVTRAGPLHPSFRLALPGLPAGVPLPIDHVYAPGGGQVELRPLIGADHHGLLARVHLSP